MLRPAEAKTVQPGSLFISVWIKPRKGYHRFKFVIFFCPSLYILVLWEGIAAMNFVNFMGFKKNMYGIFKKLCSSPSVYRIVFHFNHIFILVFKKLDDADAGQN